MTVSHSEILAYAIGDATPEVRDRVRLAVQSDPECANALKNTRAFLTASSETAEGWNGEFAAAMTAALEQLRTEKFAAPSRRRTTAVRWSALAAVACGLVLFSLFRPTPDVPSVSSVPVNSAISFVAVEISDGAQGRTAFASLASGVSAVESGGTVSIARGTTPETIRIVKPVRLVAASGPVVIGARNT